MPSPVPYRLAGTPHLGSTNFRNDHPDTISSILLGVLLVISLYLFCFNTFLHGTIHRYHHLRLQVVPKGKHPVSWILTTNIVIILFTFTFSIFSCHFDRFGTWFHRSEKHLSHDSAKVVLKLPKPKNNIIGIKYNIILYHDVFSVFPSFSHCVMLRLSDFRFLKS